MDPSPSRGGRGTAGVRQELTPLHIRKQLVHLCAEKAWVLPRFEGLWGPWGVVRGPQPRPLAAEGTSFSSL